MVKGESRILMILERLELTNYRNYRALDLSLAPGLNIICGDNAQGKTNLLEAIYYLGTLRSFRIRSESELLAWEQTEAGIKASFSRSDAQKRILEVRWARNNQGRLERRVKRNELVVSNYGEFLREVPLVLFVPQDLALVSGAPELRRRYLDVLLCKTSEPYLRCLVRYQQILRQRNEWWRSERDPRWNELAVWDEQLVDMAEKIVLQRVDAVKRLGLLAEDIFTRLSERPINMKARYVSSLGTDKGKMLEELHRRRRQEMQRRVTLAGPHRDDIVFTMEGRSLKLCASQGQLRSLALALRLAESVYMSDVQGNKAIILLDDCFSELDKGRCRRLFEYLCGLGQVLLTTTDSLECTAAASRYRVEAGCVREEA